MTIAREDITGLVLAGSTQGVDKGLQNHQGMPLALHVLMRLTPQVGATLVHATRNLAAYESMGAPVWPDTVEGRPGPWAGLLAGLEHCETPYLVSVPCDEPDFPEDLVTRLAEALAAEEADIAVLARDGRLDAPAYSLVRASLAESLAEFLHRGGEPARWMAGHRTVEVPFDDFPTRAG